MRKLSFILLTIFLTAISFASHSQGNTSTITVTKMGTLGTTISDTEKKIITKLILKGEINADDFEVMKTQMPNLKHLDLKDVTCENDEIPHSAFGATTTTVAHQGIESIVLPLSIKKIVAHAFRNCRNLTGTLILPEGLTYIDALAFSNCPLTGSLKIPDKVKLIGSSAFSGCDFTGTLTLSSELTTIGNAAFKNAGFTGALKIPNTVRNIYPSAFEGCAGFTGSLVFPDGLRAIYDNAFEGCTGFTGSVTIPNSVSMIRAEAFNGCVGINAFIFPHDKVFPYSKTKAGALTKMFEHDAEIRVPSNLVAGYKAADGWKKFHDGSKIVGL